MVAHKSLNFLRRPAVRARLGLSDSGLYDEIRRGRLSRPVKMGSVSAWPEAEIDAYQEARIRERDERARRAERDARVAS
jgi:prophage regulatory protein